MNEDGIIERMYGAVLALHTTIDSIRMDIDDMQVQLAKLHQLAAKTNQMIVEATSTDPAPVITTEPGEPLETE